MGILPLSLEKKSYFLIRGVKWRCTVLILLVFAGLAAFSLSECLNKHFLLIALLRLHVVHPIVYLHPPPPPQVSASVNMVTS